MPEQGDQHRREGREQSDRRGAAPGETGRLLDLLGEEPSSELAPQPVAGDLPRLVDDFRACGPEVTLVMDGPTDGLPAGVDLSVFRIVEEGLTNVLKHAPDRSVRVAPRADANDLDLESAGGHGAGELYQRWK